RPQSRLACRGPAMPPDPDQASIRGAIPAVRSPPAARRARSWAGGEERSCPLPLIVEQARAKRSTQFLAADLADRRRREIVDEHDLIGNLERCDVSAAHPGLDVRRVRRFAFRYDESAAAFTQELVRDQIGSASCR